MNYPIWEVPYLGGTWIIGLIASIHIFISHFAVGGGAFFALTEQWAYKTGDERIYDFLKKHSLFFLVLTTVSGAVTGVGIWWAISLVSPNGTATLIQTYTLGWAEEYLFFVAEIATIFVYYYTWDKISRKDHLNLARWYFFLSVMTLVIINGILTFMLTPGAWLETKYWFQGFFNETYWPSLFIRLLIMFAIAGMYSLVTSSLIKDQEFRAKMLRYSAKWFLPVFFLGPIIGWWYLSNVPPAALETVFSGIQSSGVGNFSIMARALYLSLILSGTVILFAFVGPYLNPKGFSFHSAILFLVCGLLVTGITEWSREMLRKPYVVYDYMYSNGVLKEQVAEYNIKGYIPDHPNLSGQKLGKAMFRYQCMSCHTVNGYRSMSRLLGERDQQAIEGLLTVLHETDAEKNPYSGIMPPLVGTDDEIKALAEYLYTINHPEAVRVADEKETASDELVFQPASP